MKQEEISIKVNIADVTYPLKVTLDDEEYVRRAAKLINDKIRAFREDYQIEDKVNLLSMVALEFATGLLHYKEKPHIEDNGVSETVEDIHIMLREGLQGH